ncbi:MAG: MlaD family protein [Acidobacteriota bacterium]|nr:MlaD family protein [Acidobacteriota bacterium]
MNREVRVGLMFAVAIGILGVALYYLGSFQEQITYKIRFDKVLGLARDSPVQYNGVPIGRVTKIVLAEQVTQDEEVPIIVTIAVHRSVRNHIRTTTEADIRSVGILGDKSILLVTSDYSAPVLEEGAYIPPTPKVLDVDKLLAQGTDIVADVTSITTDLRALLDRLANQDGPLQTAINDKKMADELRGTVSRLATLVGNDDSMLAMLMNDPEFAALVRERLDTLTANLETISDDFKEGKGMLPMLLEDETFRDEVKTQITTLLETSNQYAKELKDGRGLLHKMSQDEAYAERVSANLEKASYHLASILEKIDTGDGTASLLINDPSLYQGVYEVVYGLQHSGISKWYIQRKQKKGAKLRAKEKDQEQN